jgi:hypothetical protein
MVLVLGSGGLGLEREGEGSEERDEESRGGDWAMQHVETSGAAF